VASLLTATPTPRTLPRQQDAATGAGAGNGAAAPNRVQDPAQKPAGAHR